MSSLPVVVQFSDRSVSFHFDGMLSEQIGFLMQIAEELTVCEFQLLKYHSGIAGKFHGINILWYVK